MFQASHEWATMTTFDALYRANMRILLSSVFVTLLMQIFFNFRSPCCGELSRIVFKLLLINFLCTTPVLLSLTYQPVLAGMGINSTANMLILAPLIQIVACLFSSSAIQAFASEKGNYQVVLLKEAPVRAAIPEAYQNG